MKNANWLVLFSSLLVLSCFYSRAASLDDKLDQLRRNFAGFWALEQLPKATDEIGLEKAIAGALGLIRLGINKQDLWRGLKKRVAEYGNVSHLRCSKSGRVFLLITDNCPGGSIGYEVAFDFDDNERLMRYTIWLESLAVTGEPRKPRETSNAR